MDASKQKETTASSNTVDGSSKEDNDYDEVDPLSPLSAMLSDLNTFVESGGEVNADEEENSSTSPEAKFGASSYKDVRRNHIYIF